MVAPSTDRAPAVLLVTGAPATGKSATARSIASGLPLGAAIDVDDVRQLVLGGHAAPWDGAEGRRQQQLGVQNACALAERLRTAGVAVVMSDLVDPTTLPTYRALLTDVRVVRLVCDEPERRARADARPRYLTTEEEQALVRTDAALATHDLDATIDVTHLQQEEQRDAVLAAWLA